MILRGDDAQAIGFRRNSGGCGGRGGKRRGGERDEGLEKSGGMDLRGGMLVRIFAPEDGDVGGDRLKCADENAGFARGGGGVRAENGKWLRMFAANDEFDFGGGDAGIGERLFGNARMVQSAQCGSPKLRFILLECERGGERAASDILRGREVMRHREFRKGCNRSTGAIRRVIWRRAECTAARTARP